MCDTDGNADALAGRAVKPSRSMEAGSGERPRKGERLGQRVPLPYAGNLGWEAGKDDEDID